QEAVSKYLPKAKIVFDHFHVIKLFNEKLSDLRRNLFHQAEEEGLFCYYGRSDSWTPGSSAHTGA
ncbi:MAG: transposase, partial [Isosphaeraceae bacterium]